jgi:endonuclease VIII
MGRMPEGDTVWRTAARLRAALAGRILVRADLRVPRLATRDLAGLAVTDVVPRGKHLLTRLDGALTLHSHLRMDGSWHTYGRHERWRGGPAWQVRVVLENAGWVAVGYRLPVVDLVPTAEEDRVVGHLGPDVLGPDWSLGAVLTALAADPGREIGVALLDQRVLAGLGNIWRTEACFLAGVTPWTPVGEVPDLPGLLDRTRRLISAAAHTGRQATTGSPRRGEEFWVYGRAGRPCRRCGTRIRSAEQAERAERAELPAIRDPAAGEDATDTIAARHAGTGMPARREVPVEPVPGGAMLRIASGMARVTAWCPLCQRGPAPHPDRTAPAGGPRPTPPAGQPRPRPVRR